VSGVTAYERVLTASRVFLDPGWLPPAADCEELADLRAEHERLLAACADALANVGEVQIAVDLAAEARGDALREAILAGQNPATVDLLEPDDTGVREAQRIYEAACEVLEQFVTRAQEQIEERAPTVRAGVEGLVRDAHEKRMEARRLLEEADRLEAEPKRLLHWLDRYTTVEDPMSGEQRKASVLGPIAYESLDLPRREPVPELFEEIAGLPPATVIDVGSDEISEQEKEAMTRA
jgi:hypothetical protein